MRLKPRHYAYLRTSCWSTSYGLLYSCALRLYKTSLAFVRRHTENYCSCSCWRGPSRTPQHGITVVPTAVESAMQLAGLFVRSVAFNLQGQTVRGRPRSIGPSITGSAVRFLHVGFRIRTFASAPGISRMLHATSYLESGTVATGVAATVLASHPSTHRPTPAAKPLQLHLQKHRISTRYGIRYNLTPSIVSFPSQLSCICVH